MTYKIDHDRPNCIGCGACAAVAPEFWKMSSDGKSELKAGKNDIKNGEIIRAILTINDEHYAKNKEAADCCPVNVIHIFNIKGEKII